MEGKTISGYTIKKRLGIGGMAEVWYAENKIGKNAAVKVLLPELCRNTNIVERFVTEAKTMVMLNHPNIRQVYDYGDIDGCPAIVMEYLDGDDLKAKMKQGMRFTDEELIKWWNQLVDALKYTHSKGVVHRDIKPGNIFVDKEGNIKLLDFGIAKVRESITSTQTGQKLGTLMYMSPEQVRDSKHIDYHTDIYSLAVTFVHLVTGRKPYDSDTYSDFDIQTSIVSKPLDLSEMPEKWQNFLAPYLNKEASKRPELRPFDANAAKIADIKTENKAVDKDEATVVDDVIEEKPAEIAKKPEKPAEPKKKKSNTGLWIGIGIAVAAVVVVVLLLGKPSKTNKSAKDEDDTAYYEELETKEFESCTTVDEYRHYISKYNKSSDYYNPKHYKSAKAFIDQYITDSINYAFSVEFDAYINDTSVAKCDEYLQKYPNGRYVDEVKQRKAELIEKEKRKQAMAAKPQVPKIEVINIEEIVEDEITIDPGLYIDSSLDEVIEEEEIFVSVEEQPEFPGGLAKLMEFVQRNLKYPMQARESDIQGRVYVGFVVEKDGSISNVEVLRGIGGGCDEEAVRVVESLPKFKPGKHRGNPVRVRYTLPIVFKLD